MADSMDEIFLLENETLRPLPVRPMQQGLFGASLEDALQTLLQNYPRLIPGKQIDPDSDDPPRFVLLRREMPVAGWSLDHLYVDQRGILTLVETKLMQNPEARRDVIGQIIEYAANAADAWGSGRARQHAAEFWRDKGRELDEVLLETFDDLDIEDFWSTVEDNLRLDKMRLIVAADELRPEVRRMIEYLNKEMQNTEVLGLELKCYGKDASSLVLVPRLVGQTQADVDRRRGGNILWSVGKLRDALASVENAQNRERIQRILDGALKRDCFATSRSQNPVFGLESEIGRRIFTIRLDGHVHMFFGEKKYRGGAEERDALFDELKNLGMFEESLRPEDVIASHNCSRILWELDEQEFAELLDILERYCKASR
ncbi:MAG: hypothetical protein U9R48_05240 [Chloroflexota bacterium]|nr:hypothetical protein [Chloroflexota bacterium]